MEGYRAYRCPEHGDTLDVIGMGADRAPLHVSGGCGKPCEVIEYVPAEQLRGAVEAIDAAHQVILDALSFLHPNPAHELMETSSYKAFAAYVKRGR